MEAPRGAVNREWRMAAATSTCPTFSALSCCRGCIKGALDHIRASDRLTLIPPCPFLCPIFALRSWRPAFCFEPPSCSPLPLSFPRFSNVISPSMYAMVCNNVTAFVPAQDGNAVHPGGSAVPSMAGMRYAADMATPQPGVRARAASPPRASFTAPARGARVNPQAYGLGAARASGLVPGPVAGGPQRSHGAPSAAFETPVGGFGIGADESGSREVLGTAAGSYTPCQPRAPDVSHASAWGQLPPRRQGGSATPERRPSTDAVTHHPTGQSRRPRPPQGSHSQCPPLHRGASRSPSPSRVRRSSPAGTSSPRTGSPAPARTSGGRFTTAAGGGAPATPSGPRATAPATSSAQVADLCRTTAVGFCGVRREITTLRKEVAIMNNQQRHMTKKIDDVAVLADRFSVLLSLQRRSVVDIATNTGKVLAAFNALELSRGATAPPASGGSTMATPQSLDEMQAQDAQWVLDLRPRLVEFLTKLITSPSIAADVWADNARVNDFLVDETAKKHDICAADAQVLLERKWRLPQRPRRQPTAAEEAESSPAVVRVSRRDTVGFRYLHRGVSHFYQKVGNKAVAAFLSFINDDQNIGALRRLRGTVTKTEVVLAPEEAAQMLVDDQFITDFKFHAGILRALTVVFSMFGALQSFSEDAAVRGGPRVIACRVAHVALVTMKIRQHLKMRAAVDSGEEDEAIAVPALNAGHRAEWVEELAVVSDIFSSQGDGVCNGLRLTDGADLHRADPTYKPSNVGTNGGGGAGSMGQGVLQDGDAETAAASAAWHIAHVADDEGEDEDLDAALEAAHAAFRSSMEEEGALD